MFSAYYVKKITLSHMTTQVNLFFFALAFLKKCKPIILRTCSNLFCVSIFFLMKGFQFSLKNPLNHLPHVFPEAELWQETAMQLDYLRSESRKHTQESGETEPGKGESQGRVKREFLLWSTGAQSHCGNSQILCRIVLRIVPLRNGEDGTSIYHS